jgi:WD40 repeat protein
MFDPYHKWLGIPKDQRPPTHYQLLGVSPQERDPEVIEEAAIRQTTHVRAYQLGAQADECTRILKEIATARLTLLNSAKRKEYDEQLGRAGKVPPAPAPAPAPEAHITARPAQRIPAAAAAVAPGPVIGAEDVEPAAQPGKRSGLPIGLIIGVGGGAVVGVLALVLIAVGVVFLMPRDEVPPKKDGKPVAVLPKDGKDGKKQVRDEAESKKDKENPKKIDEQPKKDDVPLKKTEPDPGPGKEPPFVLASKGRVAPEVLAELPNQTSSSCLSADGLRLAYTPLPANESTFCYREAPQFDREYRVKLDPPSFLVEPHVSSPDGKKLVLFTGQFGGPGRVLLWDWATMQVEASFSTFDRPRQAVLAPDMRHLAVYSARLVQNGVSDFWVQLYRIGPPVQMISQWKLDAPLTFFGFTPDRKIFFQQANAQSARTWSLDEAQPDKAKSGEISFASRNPRAFSADFNSYVIQQSALQFQLRHLDPGRPTRTIRCPGEGTVVDGMRFSPDSRYLLIGTHVGAKPQDAQAQIALLDLKGGEVVSVTDRCQGIATKIQLAANGVALAQGSNFVPRVYRFPTGPGDTFVRLDPPKKEGPLAKENPPKIKENPPVKAVRVAVPDADKVLESEKAVREQFKKEYAKKTAGEIFALAEKLHKLAAESADDPVATYVLLRETRDLAIKAGRPELAMRAAAELSDKYEIDELAGRVETLSSFSKVPMNAENSKQFVEIALLHAGNAMVDDHFDESLKMLWAAESVAKRSSATVLLPQVEKQLKQVKDVAKEHEDVKKAEEKLSAEPKDAEANLTVGLYLTCRKGQWEKGLPLLAQGASPELQELAKKDLAAPDDDKAHVELGDAWWNAAEKKPTHQKAAMQWRAAFWYRQAMPSLKGLTEARVAERLKQIDAQPAPFRVAAGVAEVDRFKGHKGSVNWLSISSDGKRLYSCGEDGTLRGWDLATGKTRIMLGPQITRASLICFALPPDERHAALLNAGGRLSSFDLTTLKPAIGGERDAVPGFYWSSNSTVAHAFKASWQNWNPVQGNSSGGPLVFGREVRGNLRALAMAPECNMGALLTGEEVVTFRVQENGLRLANATINFEATAAGFPRDPRLVVLGGKEGNLRAYGMSAKANESGKEIGSFKGHSGTIRCIACTADGKTMVSGSDDKTVRVWDVASGKQLQRFSHPSMVTHLVITPDGRYIVSACTDSNIRVWSLAK